MHRIINDVPDDANVNHTNHMSWNGGTINNVSVWSYQEAYEQRYRFQRYAYENIFPAIRDVEQAVDDVIRKRISMENTKSWVFFFNPIVLFNDISMKIAGNSRADYLRFLQRGREMRDDLFSIGAREGWLFDYRFFTLFADEDLLGSMESWMEKMYSVGWEDVWAEVLALADTAERFSFDVPVLRGYEQPNPGFGEIFMRVVAVLAMFVVSILVLWVMIWVRFGRYDVR
jgi:hypothetical protein